MKGIVVGEQVVVYVSWQDLDRGGAPLRPLIEGTVIGTSTTDTEELQFLIQSNDKRGGVKLVHHRWVFPERLRKCVWFKVPGGENVSVRYC